MSQVVRELCKARLSKDTFELDSFIRQIKLELQFFGASLINEASLELDYTNKLKSTTIS